VMERRHAITEMSGDRVAVVQGAVGQKGRSASRSLAVGRAASRAAWA
jgi:hypothetical protein